MHDNGNADTLKELLKISAPDHTLSLDLQNASGNTALHWATLNGQLDAVKLLVEAGADVTVCNKAGHDALFAAEANDKTAVAEWLLKSAKGVASVIAGSRGGEAEVEAMASDEAQASDGMEKKEETVKEETMKEEEPKRP